MFDDLVSYKTAIRRRIKSQQASLEFFGLIDKVINHIQESGRQNKIAEFREIATRKVKSCMDAMQLQYDDEYLEKCKKKYAKLKEITSGKKLDTSLFDKYVFAEKTVYNGRKLLSSIKNIGMYVSTLKKILNIPIIVPEHSDPERYDVSIILEYLPLNHPYHFDEFDRFQDGYYDNHNGRVTTKIAGYAPTYVSDILSQESNVLNVIHEMIILRNKVFERGHKVLDVIKTQESADVLKELGSSYADFTTDFFPYTADDALDRAIEIATHCYK